LLCSDENLRQQLRDGKVSKQGNHGIGLLTRVAKAFHHFHGGDGSLVCRGATVSIEVWRKEKGHLLPPPLSFQNGA
jgi:hypothetical protein